jgi:hypothetical protein
VQSVGCCSTTDALMQCACHRIITQADAHRPASSRGRATQVLVAQVLPAAEREQHLGRHRRYTRRSSRRHPEVPPRPTSGITAASSHRSTERGARARESAPLSQRRNDTLASGSGDPPQWPAGGAAGEAAHTPSRKRASAALCHDLLTGGVSSVTLVRPSSPIALPEERSGCVQRNCTASTKV